ncbi:MAG TPA: type II toxin-antitoxin system PemK/MazF family toxin [Flavisolibacter sp.]|jgi:mRNA interferase MazF|nr:type II toxin-antitoxin system PemK/MazF family toxin [Flavisolibacter sp.]
MQKGDIVLIPFSFTDLSGNKLRPAVILAQTRVDLTVCFITSQFQWQEPTDILLQPKPTNGIKRPSLIRVSKIATLDKSLSLGKIGSVDSSDLTELDSKLKQIFRLP